MRRPPVRLYALLRKPGYALFVFVSATHLRAYRRLLDSLVQEVNNTYGGEIVRPHVVLDEGTPEAVEAEAPVLIDFKGQFRKKLGAGHGSVLLVRPDGYIAFHCAGHNLRALFAALEPWAGHGSPVRDREGHRRRLDGAYTVLAAVEQAFAKLIPGRIAGVCAKLRRSFTAQSLPPILLSGMPLYPPG